MEDMMNEFTVDDKQCNNAALFIDYENVYKTLRLQRKNIIRLGFFERIRSWCKNNNKRLVKIAVYCNFDNLDLYESHHQSFLHSYGVESVHTSNQGKNYADLQIAIDVLNTMYQNKNIDEFLIMSNDKDMTPLLNTVRLNKRKVSIITTGNDYNRTICSFADEQYKFETIISTETETGFLQITEIQNKFFESLCKHIHSKYSDYLEGRIDIEKIHYGLDYCVETQCNYLNIMKYEIANIIAELSAENYVSFYEYYYRGSSYVAILPVSKRDSYLVSGIIKEKDLIDFDIKGYVAQIYDFYNARS